MNPRDDGRHPAAELLMLLVLVAFLAITVAAVVSGVWG